MKKRKEEILLDKEQSTVQSTVQSSVQSTGQLQNSLSVKSNDTYIYGAGTLAVLAIGVSVFFAYNSSTPKKTVNEKQDQPPKRLHML